MSSGALQYRENDEEEPSLNSSYLLAKSGVPEQTLRTLEAGIDRMKAIRFLPKGPPSRRAAVLRKVHAGMGFPPAVSFKKMLHKRGVSDEDVAAAAQRTAARKLALAAFSLGRPSRSDSRPSRSDQRPRRVRRV